MKTKDILKWFKDNMSGLSDSDEEEKKIDVNV